MLAGQQKRMLAHQEKLAMAQWPRNMLVTKNHWIRRKRKRKKYSNGCDASWTPHSHFPPSEQNPWNWTSVL